MNATAALKRTPLGSHLLRISESRASADECPYTQEEDLARIQLSPLATLVIAVVFPSSEGST